MSPTLLGYINEFEDNNLQQEGRGGHWTINSTNAQCFIISFSYSLSLEYLLYNSPSPYFKQSNE